MEGGYSTVNYLQFKLGGTINRTGRAPLSKAAAKARVLVPARLLPRIRESSVFGAALSNQVSSSNVSLPDFIRHREGNFILLFFYSCLLLDGT